MQRNHPRAKTFEPRVDLRRPVRWIKRLFYAVFGLGSFALAGFLLSRMIMDIRADLAINVQNAPATRSVTGYIIYVLLIVSMAAAGSYLIAVTVWGKWALRDKMRVLADNVKYNLNTNGD